MGFLEDMIDASDLTERIEVSESNQFSEQEAIAIIIMVAISSDGQIDDGELNQALLVLDQRKIFTNVSKEKVFAKIVQFIKTVGMSEALKVAGTSLALNQEVQESTFAIAVDLVLNDGTVTEDENNFIRELQEVLAIQKSLATKIAEVMIIKNRL